MHNNKISFSLNLGGRSSSSRSVAIPPPANSGLSKQGYSTLNAINHSAITTTWGVPKKRSKTEEEYFEEEDEHQQPQLEYIPAPNSPTNQKSDVDSDSSADPLDAFMEGLEKEVKKEKTYGKKQKKEEEKGIRQDIEEEDVEESYYRYMEENPTAGLVDETSDIEIDYDEDGNPIAPPKKKEIDPLPSIDHSLIKYNSFEKNFYIPHSEISSLSVDKIIQLRKTLGLRVNGADLPYPVTSFAHFNFDDALMKAIRKSDYTQPTPIQSQAVPAALSGRDIIGIAKTGSGKTLAFIWPMLIHIMDQPELKDNDGPVGLILAPTRELSQQIYVEAKKFGKIYDLRVVCCYGGGSKWEQSKALEGGAEIIVGTPGRVIDLVKMSATNLTRVTFLVLDEADRMFNMGFEPQVRSICDHVRPDRQTLLFSATFKKKIEKLARDILTDPIRIVQGDIGEANTDVTQIMLVMPQSDKCQWLLDNIVQFTSTGSILIFVTKKLDAEQLASTLSVKEYEVLLLHGDMDQAERNKVITKFKKQEVNVMVATDVAARGLDIAHIRTVINYDIARDIDTHTHRIGRTGRAGEKGTAFTLVTPKDYEFAGHLVRSLEGVGQEVPKPLLDLAMQSTWFRKSRFKGGKGKSVNAGGAGLGYREPSGSKNYNASSSYQCPKPAAAAAPKAGPGSGRLLALKEAFKMQYQNQFKASEDHTWEQTVGSSSTVKVHTGPLKERKAKKNRWDN
ncbi:RNA helicase, DEAD-box type, Q motif,Helicase, C-terminal,ATP-dependent RNA helicase DEAD-box, conserved [Cinara cedri]|uniref:RNA helicase n=1 Tax=Cinara cedri TaxID=506608 RepID=A0A5E4NI38_9HEMI|nr:RNA helicase, DEAD-box type, Q motif,Helicase, C-terminal,ATP-dependent RNA helicase DEAD-box, conserved [Cinara cedri]